MDVKENRTGKKTRKDKLHPKPTNVTVVADTDLQDADASCQNTLQILYKCYWSWDRKGGEEEGNSSGLLL